MKYLFLAISILLAAASVGVWRTMPGTASARPILYWVTDSNPAREDQIHLFHLWQVRTGHKATLDLASADAARAFLAQQTRVFARSLREINPPLDRLANGGDAGIAFPLTVTLPVAEMRTDTANADLTKRIIQGVSGVGGDVMDMWNGVAMRQLQGMGLLRDVTDDAAKLGFGPDKTYPAILPEIAIPTADGAGWRQYQFPCNVAAFGFIANLEQFEKLGLPPPPRQWTIDAFEQQGREYVRRANAGLPRPLYFFAAAVDSAVIRRSFGASELNETMTRCTLDEPRSVAAMERQIQWQDVDRIIPSAVDRAGFATDSGFGGQEAQLFNAGNYAMTWTGRYMLIQFRKFNVDRARAGKPPLRCSVSEPPYAVFPNTNIGTRAAAVYAGGKRQDLAVLFQAYLASEEYNMQVVRDADALPPNPAFTKREEYARPKPNPSAGIYPETENGVHGPMEEIAETIALASSHSPFILQSTVAAEIKRAEEVALNHVASPAEALADGARRINAELQRNLGEDPRLVPLYERKVAQQKTIDAMKAAIADFEKRSPGVAIPATLRIPASMLDNPFHRAFYLHTGWARDDATEATTTPTATTTRPAEGTR